MKCGICKAEIEESTVTYTEDVQLEKMVDQFAASEGSEVSVINFAKSVA